MKYSPTPTLSLGLAKQIAVPLSGMCEAHVAASHFWPTPPVADVRLLGPAARQMLCLGSAWIGPSAGQHPPGPA